MQGLSYGLPQNCSAGYGFPHFYFLFVKPNNGFREEIPTARLGDAERGRAGAAPRRSLRS